MTLTAGDRKIERCGRPRLPYADRELQRVTRGGDQVYGCPADVFSGVVLFAYWYALDPQSASRFAEAAGTVGFMRGIPGGE